MRIVYLLYTLYNFSVTLSWKRNLARKVFIQSSACKKRSICLKEGLPKYRRLFDKVTEKTIV